MFKLAKVRKRSVFSCECRDRKKSFTRHLQRSIWRLLFEHIQCIWNIIERILNALKHFFYATAQSMRNFINSHFFTSSGRQKNVL